MYMYVYMLVHAEELDTAHTIRKVTDLLYHAVVCEGCASSVHLAETTLVDQLSGGLQVGVTVACTK